MIANHPIAGLTAALFYGFAATPGLAAEDPCYETPRLVITCSPDANGGPDVILLPGLSTPGAVWDGLVADLAGRATVYVVTVKGFGAGDGAANAAGGMIEGITTDLATFVADRQLDDPALIGHSLGGTIALRAGLRTPDTYGRLMVVDALPFVALLFDPAATLDSVRPQAEAMRDQIAAAPAGEGADRSAQTYAIGAASQALIRGWIEGADPAVVAQALYEDLLEDLRPELSQIRLPVTLIVPIPDEAGPGYAERYQALYAQLANLTTVTVPQSRHFVMLDQPDAMTQAVETFLGLPEPPSNAVLQ
jgi:pimeloyl-ACP methyl ester carboxylesterase